MATAAPSAISVIVPTLNEAENIGPLVQRIHAALDRAQVPYEIIVVDDRSTDDTVERAAALADLFPLRVFTKRGERGKALSILEGVTYAHHDIVCMIDADQQYPPEHIPAMLARLDAGADIVVANRVQRNTSMVRNVFSTGYRTIFSSFLLGLNIDVQSGLKLFRKAILARLDIAPGPWSLDLELLTQARDAGYVIDQVEIPFSERVHGETKVSLLGVSVELARAALRIKARGHRPIPVSPNAELAEDPGFHHKGRHFVTHSRLPHNESALEQLSRPQIVILAVLAVALVAAFVLNAHAALTALLAVLTALYFLDLLFSVFLIYRSLSAKHEIVISEEELAAVGDREWPRYTIFCPLYKEWEVLPQFVEAMEALDYPAEKLQVMLLLEENDPETIKAARAMSLPANFEIVVVPHSLPKTKPKACNYGLTKATGEYVVIYDAEDVPDPQQLKKAVLAFERVNPQVRCIQAKLNFYNPEQNLLTRMFTAEYSCWFDLILPGLQSIKAPIPLGGTSNHFRIRDLLDLHGWDAFNVTEDCDLGIRLAKLGYTTQVIDSTTYEEANSDAVNWFWQRSRWIKGYLQSYLVHMRNPGAFLRGPNKLHLFTFQLVVGGKVFSLFINPLMWLLTVSYFAGRSVFGEAIESLFSPLVLYLAVFSLVFGNFMFLYNYMVGCARREYYTLIKYMFLVPIYWLGMSLAAWMALYKLVVQPHHWSKTRHGLHLKSAAASSHATSHHMLPEPEHALELNA